MSLKHLFPAALALSVAVSAGAQRLNTPRLDRGLVAVSTQGGVFCSWRITGEEYYDVAYNIYRDGAKLNDKPLLVSNFMDAGGSSSSKYTVRAVVRGVEQDASSEVAPLANQYLEITPKHDASISEYTFQPNDATAADLDGDGQPELLVKFINDTYHGSKDYTNVNVKFKAYDIIEAYKLDGTKLWWIDCGPNMIDFQSNEINIASADWDGDGLAECVMRAADNTIVYHSDGSKTVIGDPTVDTRNTLSNSGGYQAPNSFSHAGGEYLLYMEGLTSKLYKHNVSYEANKTPYPLKRLETGETDLEKAWGDAYGHRSTKHFFGAPYLDGKKPSIFLARGIYTRHKMISFDVDPASHQLTQRWEWHCSNGGVWYGQGYHNYTVADVDMDGRDEIVFGSMIIDDNGKGLNSTGFGHGDAHHVGDLNPYVHGLEFFGCLEDNAGNNYKDATTGKIYYSFKHTRDCGRANAGNFTNDHYGAIAQGSYDASISCVTNGPAGLDGLSQNFRIYWDGDLLEEFVDGGDAKPLTISKYKVGNLLTLNGTLSNNSTKSTPCLQADLFGDWREELMVRTPDGNIRIYTTIIPTEWRNYTLMDDHQYRNAIIHQMNGYNQPPHVSYFLGERDKITVAPPPVILRDRELVAEGGSVTTAHNDKHVVLYETADAAYTIGEGAQPYILTVNTPSWVQGTHASNSTTDTKSIIYAYYKHTLSGAPLTGSMRLIKQGDGALNIHKAEHTYTGETNVWGGEFVTDGSFTASPIWLNRFAKLISSGSFRRNITAEYGAQILPGGAGKVGTLTADSVTLNFGSRIVMDLNSDGTADKLISKYLKLIVNTDDIKDELPFFKPIIEFKLKLASGETAFPAGEYLIGEIGSISSSIEDIKVVAPATSSVKLKYEGGKLYAVVSGPRAATTIFWRGSEESNVWDFGDSANFVDAEGNPIAFVSGDNVVFDDNAIATTVKVDGELAPGSVSFVNVTKPIVIEGDGFAGSMALAISGGGHVTLSNVSSFTGGTMISNGSILKVSQLAYSEGADLGALGGVDAVVSLDNSTLETTGTVNASHKIVVIGVSTINVPAGSTLRLNRGIIAKDKTQQWHKTGTGVMYLANAANAGELHVVEGTVYGGEYGTTLSSPPTVYLEGGTYSDKDDMYSYSNSSTNFVVPEGKRGYLNLDSRCSYSGTLTGSGYLTVTTRNTRADLNGDWSAFEGTLNIKSQKTGQYDPSFDFKNSKGLPNAKVVNATTFNSGGKSLTLGEVTGAGTLQGGGVYSIGSLGTDFNMTNTITGSGLAKVGSGTMTMKTRQTGVTGDVNVTDGTLNLRTLTVSEDSKFFPGKIYVKGAGVLSGRASVGQVFVTGGGTLRPGDAQYYPSMKGYLMASYAQIASSSKLEFHLFDGKGSVTSHSQLRVTGTLALDGTVNITIDPLYKEPKAGTAFTLWTSGTLKAGSTVKVNLPALPAGLAWDTTDLLKDNGILRIVEKDTPIQTIDADEAVIVTVLNLVGQQVARFEATLSTARQKAQEAVSDKGLYIVSLQGANTADSFRIIVK